jgi:hypothetical protein
MSSAFAPVNGAPYVAAMAEKASGQDQRKARLARRLRENLKRRKAQIRSRREPPRTEKAD